MTKRDLDFTLHCRLTRKDVARLDALAAANDLTASQIVRRALREIFARKDLLDERVQSSFERASK